MNQNKPLVIYHKNCLDGFGAAFAAWKKFGDTAEYLPLDYSEREEFVFSGQATGRDIYILDFSFLPHQFAALQLWALSIVMLDHHKTAFEALAPEGCYDRYEDTCGDTGVYILLDNEHSGAHLAWCYFHPDAIPVPQVIQYIEDRDLWLWKQEGTKDACMGLSMLPQHFEVWDDMLVLENLNEVCAKGEAINGYYKEQLTRAVSATKEPCTILGHSGLCANLPPMFASEAGSVLATESGTFGATWFKDTTGNIKWSLRSIGDYDVSAIAKQFGGGGHKNAAGFTLTPDSGETVPGVKLWQH